MTQTQTASRRRLLAVTALAAVGAALLAAVAIGASEGAAPTSAAAGVSCHGADEPAGELGRKQLRKAVRCLVNERRAIRGLGALARNRSLEKTAQRHSKVMVETDCLAHRCEGERRLESRLRRAGYFAGASSWRYAENTGCGASAEAMVSSWMERSYHRTNILDKGFREVGIGVTGRPVEGRCEPGYATFAMIAGRRTLAD